MKQHFYNVIRRYLLLLNRRKAIFLLGDGRSGTTWIAAMLNFDGRYLDYFEPYHGQRILNIPDRRVYPVEAELPEGAEVFEKYVLCSNIFAGQQKPTGWALSGCLIKDVSSHLILERIKGGFDKKVLIIRNPLSVALSKEGYGKWHVEADIDALSSGNYELRLLVQQCRIENLLHSRFLEYVLVWCLLQRLALPHAIGGGMHIVFYEDLLANSRAALYDLFEYVGCGPHFEKNTERIMSALKKESRTTSQQSRIEESSRNAPTWKDLKSKSEIDQAYAILRKFSLFYIYKEEARPQIKTTEFS